MQVVIASYPMTGGSGGNRNNDNDNPHLGDSSVKPVKQGPAVWTELGPGNFDNVQFNSGFVYTEGSNGAVILGGTTGGGLLRGSESTGPDGWQRILEGDVGAVIVDPEDSRIIYASTLNETYSPRIAIRKSTDGGKTFNLIRFGMTEAGGILTPLSPLVIDPGDAKRLWTGGQHIWRTDNRGANWSRAHAETFLGAFRSLDIAGTDTNRALAGTAEGYILRTDSALTADQTTFWPSVRPRSGAVSALAFDPSDERIAYAGYSADGGIHVWKTSNGGMNWTGIDGSDTTALPDTPVNAIAIDPANSMSIYVGTNAGLFSSAGGGTTWALESGLPAVPVKALVFHTANGLTHLYAFTGGHGVWRMQTSDNACLLSLSKAEQSVPSTGSAFSIEVLSSSENIGCQWTAHSNADWITVFAGQSGMGNGLVSLLAAQNNINQSRTGTVTIAGNTLVVRQSPAVDAMPPLITITGPTSNESYQTDLETITLSGIASDDIAIDKVTLSTARGEIGIASGSNSWTISTDVRLGINVYTVTAHDTSGNMTSDVLTVIFRPGFLKSVVAGKQTPPFSGEGGAAIDARLISPRRIAFDPAGNLYFSTGMVIQRITPAGNLNTVIGGVAGFAGDGGPAGDAQLYFPEGLAIDQAGNIFIADKWNHRIRKVTPDGIIITIAGTGPNSTPTGGYSGDGGPALQAQLNQPLGIALDGTGNLYIADEGNNRIRKVGTNGIITTVAGDGGTFNSGDGGLATAASVLFPRDVAFDSAGNMYIASAADRIRKVTPNGIITTIAGAGNGYSGDGGPAVNALFRLPVAVLPDNSGNLFISDSNNGRIRRIGPDGMINTVAFAGSPVGLALGNDGAIYIAENPGLGRISRLAIFPPPEQVSPAISITTPQTTTGHYTTLNEFLTFQGIASDNLFLTHVSVTSDRGLKGVAEGADNWRTTVILKTGINRLIFTAWDMDGNSTSIQFTVNYVKSQMVNAVAGLRGSAGYGGDDGNASTARFNTPNGIVFDSAGNLYIADTGNHRIRRISVSGNISTVAGTGDVGLRLESGPAIESDLNEPRGVAIDHTGNLFFADTQNHRICRISTAGVLSTIAGDGVMGATGDGAAATEARLNLPLGVAVDGSGNVFISDTGNRRIRRVDSLTGVISTIADESHGLQSPAGLITDVAGNLYVADNVNGGRVYKVTPANAVSVFAGTGSGDASPNGVPATQFGLTFPNALTFDGAGNLYIIEEFYARIVRVATNALADTVAILNGLGFEEDDSPPSIFSNRGTGIAIDSAGRIFFSDAGNHRIGVVVSNAFAPVVAVSGASFLGTGLSPSSIGAAFGVNLATGIEEAKSLPLPATLAGTTAIIRDRQGGQQPLQLFYVSPLQVNFLMPRFSISAGLATLAITNTRGEVSLGSLEVVTVAPALFAANGNGQGPAAAVVLRIKPDGAQIYEPMVDYDQSQGRFIARPIDLGTIGDEVVLVLFGTGIHASGGQANVKVTIGNVDGEVLFAGGQGELVGLDQVNLRLPVSLAGSGDVEIKLSINDKPANSVWINIR